MIRAGLCKRNAENRVVLPSGAYVPKEIQGRLLSERIEEWHRRNPNQVATATLLNTIKQAPLSPGKLLQDRAPQNSFQLSTSD